MTGVWLLGRRCRRDAAGGNDGFGRPGGFRGLRIALRLRSTGKPILHRLGGQRGNRRRGDVGLRQRRSAARLRWSKDWSAAIRPATIRAGLPKAAHSATATNRSARPPMSKVYLARRPMSRSTIIMSCCGIACALGIVGAIAHPDLSARGHGRPQAQWRVLPDSRNTHIDSQ